MQATMRNQHFGLSSIGAQLRLAIGATQMRLDIVSRVDAVRNVALTPEVNNMQADLQQRLHTTIGEVRTAVLSIETAAGEIAASSNDLSARTEQSASSLQQTASSKHALTGTVKSAAWRSARPPPRVRSSAWSAPAWKRSMPAAVGSARRVAPWPRSWPACAASAT